MQTKYEKPRFQQFALSEGATITTPDHPDPITVTHLLFYYWMDETEVIRRVVVDPTSLSNLGSKFDFKNVLTNESIIIDRKTLLPALRLTCFPVSLPARLSNL